MTLFADTSVLLRIYAGDHHRPFAVEHLRATHVVAVSALARTELLMAMEHMAMDADQAAEAAALVRSDWDCWARVPVDDACLAAAAHIGARFGIRISDAIHLAAATRCPQPVRFITLTPPQVTPAAALGFDVIAPRTL